MVALNAFVKVVANWDQLAAKDSAGKLALICAKDSAVLSRRTG
jgi:hypothetical protein